MSMKKKVLLMGRSASGKTSMRSIIFANLVARETSLLGPTIDVEHTNVKFLGNLVLNIWDCGGQETFLENYLHSQRDHIFRNVEVLIYLFDVGSPEFQSDLLYYHSMLKALREYSEGATVFCLIHKMDLIPEDQREIIFKQRERDVQNASMPHEVLCFPTSIWDETLYKAWSGILCSLIPNVDSLEKHLRSFGDISECDEVVLFERATFLVIASSTRAEQSDPHRFEKISNIIKQFKLSCQRATSHFQSMEITSPRFSAFIESFTTNTYIMVIMSGDQAPPAATHMNIQIARNHFERLISSTSTGAIL